MKIDRALLIWVPSRRGKGQGKTFPIGLLYVGRVLEDMHIGVTVYDVYKDAFEPGNKDKFSSSRILDIIKKQDPQVVGFGGIASSYGWTKVLSNQIKKTFPDIIQIAGGSLSSTYKLLLTNTAIDAVFHGEIERSLPPFIEGLRNSKKFYDVPGISYSLDGRVVRNQPADEIKNLDDIPFPAYHLADLKYYLSEEPPFYKRFLASYKEDLKRHELYECIEKKINGVFATFPIVTARGCTHHCSFCFRHMRGYRKHSVDYVVRHIKYVKEKFNISGIDFYDELFNGDMQWVFDFCDALEKNNLNITYKTSARADAMSEELLLRMSKTGCYNLEYGQESGSDKILKEYRKGITRDQNVEITKLTNRCGIYSAVQLVIGSPSETNCTIKETIDFLKEVNAEIYSLNYLLPFPETPIWRYVEEMRLIDDVERYLDTVSEIGGGPIVNLTSAPDSEWRNWGSYIFYNLRRHHARQDRNRGTFLKSFIRYHAKRLLPLEARAKLKSFFYTQRSAKERRSN